MTINELKKYIYENNKIYNILDFLNCHNITYDESKKFYRASFPDGDNPKGINITNDEYLRLYSFSRGITFEDNKDLISLVEIIKKISFKMALKYLCDILGLSFDITKKEEKTEEKQDQLDIFKRQIKPRKGCKKTVDVNDINYLDENLIHEYVPNLYIDWALEGITEKTRKKFDISYSFRKKRIIIPHRHWETGKLLGFNERTTVDNYDEFGINKFYLTKGYDKSLNLYGLYENKEEIERKGYVVVVEAEKSVLKRDSLLDGVCVALSGKTMSQEQVSIINGLNIREVVLALDNDVGINEVRFMAEKFFKYKKVSYIKDTFGILGEKDSPCDACDSDYRKLFKNRITYDKHEHELYKESLKKK